MANLQVAGPSVNIRWTAMTSEMQPERRAYRKRRRAEHETQTRRQITEAAMKLHGTVGPARTTITGIAAEAGVQRATVYRHFPDLDSLFISCSAHWASLNPPPDPGIWRLIADPEKRVRHGLTELYDWYAWADPMLTNIFRDAPLVPAMARASENFQRQFEALHGALMQGRQTRGHVRARVAGAIGHALEFGSWRSLTQTQGLNSKEAVELMIVLIAAAARPQPRLT
jgi:AcrR family transcriptional regulator